MNSCNHWPGQIKCGVCGMDEKPRSPADCPSCSAKTEQWWSYCAMCGYHIAGGSLALASQGRDEA